MMALGLSAEFGTLRTRGRILSNARNDNDPETKRGQILNEYLRQRGVANIEDAPDELLDAAHKSADEILRVGKDNWKALENIGGDRLQSF
jgi:hypothetical protein